VSHNKPEYNKPDWDASDGGNSLTNRLRAIEGAVIRARHVVFYFSGQEELEAREALRILEGLLAKVTGEVLEMRKASSV
jgi:hypothetical protein